jgi:hypothetical protein
MREPFDASALFGREKDAGLEGSLTARLQTLGERNCIPVWRRSPPPLGRLKLRDSSLL